MEGFIRITDQDLRSPLLGVYASSAEALLKHRYEPSPGIFIAETPNVIERALEAGYEPESALIDEKFLDAHSTKEDSEDDLRETLQRILPALGKAPVFTGDAAAVSKACGFKQARGVLCAMKRKMLPSPESVLKGAKRVCVLEDVENPTNVGSVFRSAAALGIDAVLLSFGCTDPLYRRAARVSMGGVFRIPWTFIGNKYGGWPAKGIGLLHERGFSVSAMALTEKSIPLGTYDGQRPMLRAVVFGNEQYGLKEETLSLCDSVVRIPMENGMDSLNIAAAAAIAFWEMRRPE